MAELTAINLSKCGLTDSLLEGIFRSFASISERLLYINFSYNNITHVSMPLLLKVLQKVQLAELVVDGLPLGDSSVA